MSAIAVGLGIGFHVRPAGSSAIVTYSTLQAAIDAISGTPAWRSAETILVGPGHYTMTARVDVPEWVNIIGSGRGVTNFENNTTDMFRPLGWNHFEGFRIEGATNKDLWAFDCNNATAVHVRNVEMVNNGTNARGRFLKQNGATWSILQLDNILIDYYGQGDATDTVDYPIWLENTSGAARNVDCWFHGVWNDSYQLTDYGGSVLIQNCSDVRMHYSWFRGAATYNTGVYFARTSGVTGTPTIYMNNCFHDGAVPTYNTANTTILKFGCRTTGQITDGTVTTLT